MRLAAHTNIRCLRPHIPYRPWSSSCRIKRPCRQVLRTSKPNSCSGTRWGEACLYLSNSAFPFFFQAVQNPVDGPYGCDSLERQRDFGSRSPSLMEVCNHLDHKLRRSLAFGHFHHSRKVRTKHREGGIVSAILLQAGTSWQKKSIQKLIDSSRDVPFPAANPEHLQICREFVNIIH
jgi:hypothetical protein